jgi:hypothetical protein
MATSPAQRIDAIPNVIRTQLQAILQRDPQADRIALAWHESLPAERMQDHVENCPVQLVYCPSELAIREALVDHRGPERLVILSRFDQGQLGKDVLARLWRNEPQRISPWRTLQQLLRVRAIDPRLTRGDGRWMAEALLDCYERYHGKVAFGEVLDLDTAWLTLAYGYLGYAEPRLELSALLRWSLRKDSGERVAALPTPVREHIGDWLAPALHVAGPVIEALVRNGHAQDLMAVGLACSVLFAEQLEQTELVPLQSIHSARGRFIERYLGRDTERRTLARLGQEAKETARSILNAGSSRDLGSSLDKAEQILASLDVAPALIISPVLPGGLQQRLSAFATALEDGLQTQRSEAADQAWQSLRAHWLARLPNRQAQLHRGAMALRLLRWSCNAARAPDTTAPAMLHRYVAEGSFVDWARSQLWAGEDHERLNHVYQSLARTVTERREHLNQQFAKLLPALARGDTLPPQCVPVEHALTHLVAPLAAHQPVLLLVLDGMSAAVYRELQQDLAAHAWIEISDTPDVPERCLVSALPTITEVSRSALLTGRLGAGNSSQEKQGFAEHAALKAVCDRRHPPLLLHKQDLQQPGSGALAVEARSIIAGTERKVVGAVVNAIDDQLSSSSQVTVSWDLRTLRIVHQILEAAREAGRIVVITSDHGHVLDHDTEFSNVETERGGRYRLGDALATEQEVELTGPRVVATGNRVVVPWTEKLRYTRSRSRGYHGGGSLQEVVIPLGTFVSASNGAAVPGWTELPRSVPAWWTAPDEHELNEAAALYVADSRLTSSELGRPSDGRGRSGKAADSPVDDMFERVGAPAPSGNAKKPDASSERQKSDWLDALFGSDAYQQAIHRAGRVPITDEQLRHLLGLLVRSRGTAMETTVAANLSIPKIRLRGFLSAAQKLLNVDGYPVLRVQRETGTVQLNIDALRTQFEL